jgi:hypothetical protein
MSAASGLVTVHAGDLERFKNDLMFLVLLMWVIFIPLPSGEQFFLYLRIGMGYSFSICGVLYVG